LGKNHRVILHHLEKLKEYGIVTVIKTSKNGRRKTWGIVKEKSELISEVYFYCLKNYFTQAQLERASSKNRVVR
jgi:DNA-binding transcriptional ArsR family regulator